MNVTEFAEQIVFGKTLEDKLLVPGRLTHSRKSVGPNVESLISPGRIDDLRMRHEKGSNVQPPADKHLENEHERGRLLHFLANHELLATELMALVLLKFPDAPHAFRQGVLVTLQEEQEHTRMYIRRMKECGVEFGSFPLSGQFWRIVEPMKSPMDFVSRLSLTFEQANLDYSLHFAKVFKKIGDQSTADVLQQIYEDEIGHVQHGLQWFRQWKNPEQTDWEAYQESLDFPMSPQRGRGPRGAFNRDGRIQAGLTEEFVDAIEVFRQSRGRAPTVRWFDPAAESELAGESSPKVHTLMEQLGKDLELLMVMVARQDDAALVRRMPSQAIRKKLIDVGLELPEMIPFQDTSALAGRKINDFAPWAWTPKSHAITAPMTSVTRHVPVPWDNSFGELYRKSWGSNQLKKWLTESEKAGELPDWFTSANCVGVAVFDEAGVAQACEEFGARGYKQAIFKRDLGSSGRGQRTFDCDKPLTEQDLAWVRSELKLRGPGKKESPLAVVEPALNRLIDLSFLWKCPPSNRADSKVGLLEPKFIGWTRPLVTPGRRYAGTRLGTPLLGCDERIKKFLLADRGAKIQEIVNWLTPCLTRELSRRNFTGYFGVDALVCENDCGELEVKPMVELNPRMTMGHIAKRLEKRLASGVEAMFCILTKDDWDSKFDQFEQIPFRRSLDGRWASGVIQFADVDDQTKLVPVILIGEEAMQCGRSS